MDKMDLARYKQIIESKIKILHGCDIDTSVDEDGDEIDLAQSSFLSSMAYLQKDRNNYQLSLLDDALTKIKNNDDFGLCEECGEEIGIRRLDVSPEAKYCISCAETIEKERKNYK